MKKMATNFAFGWWSPAKAKYVGFDVYQERDILKDGVVLLKGWILQVTDVVDSSAVFRNNGDEVFVAVIKRSNFVRRAIPPSAKVDGPLGGNFKRR